MIIPNTINRFTSIQNSPFGLKICHEFKDDDIEQPIDLEIHILFITQIQIINNWIYSIFSKPNLWSIRMIHPHNILTYMVAIMSCKARLQYSTTILFHCIFANYQEIFYLRHWIWGQYFEDAINNCILNIKTQLVLTLFIRCLSYNTYNKFVSVVSKHS